MKRTAKSLLFSATSLLLCIAMLLGSTYAWFTDDVNSGINQIIAGNLDVELEYANAPDGIYASVENAGDVFVAPDGEEKGLWEPGHTEVAYLKVSNMGDLALKYSLSVSPERETLGKNADGEDIKLSEILKFSATEPSATAPIAFTRATAQESAAASSVKLTEYVDTGKLEAGEVQYIALVVYMPTEVGNEANYRDSDKPSIEFKLTLFATQVESESDSFGTDYDKEAPLPTTINKTEISTTVDVTDGKVNADTSMQNEIAGANIPAGVKTESNELTLTVESMTATQSNVKLESNEILTPINVHMDGVSADNDVPMQITIKEAAMKGLNASSISLYHVENGVTTPMVNVALDEEFAEHNQFKYDPATGDVILNMATFSEVAVVADTVNPWKGGFDYSWYDADATELTIANADQFAAFGAIVGGMNGKTQDSFKDKTVKLVADINLGDKESENNSELIFYPIGYNSSDGKYEKTGVAVTTGFYNFCGTFDGNGHTVANFYQNTWEMKGDNNYYDATLQYFRDGMGLFGRVCGGTVKNLTVNNFSSDGEYTTTGVIAAYADGATFENIAIFNCNPRVYNIGNGGIVGCVGWYAKEANLKTTFKNITVDNSNKISALWGSYDVACGGIVGQYYPTSGQSSANYPANAGISFENCHISAIMDVYNDVCANYQYYAYRYTGMLIGSVRENVTIDGHSYPKMDGIEAKGCTVHFGTWNDYYYCEIIDNTTASYTHDYQMSRLTEIKAIDGTTITYLDGTTGTVPASGRANYVIVDYDKGHGTENATCYHFKDGAVWTHDMGGIQEGIDENGDGQDDLKEDKQHIYLEFNNLVTGYGWGVTSRGFNNLDGVTNLDIAQGDQEESVKKFEGKTNTLTTDRTYTIAEIFTYIENCGVNVVDGAVSVTITNLDENGNVIATFTRGEKWNEGTISFENTGNIAITIQDYYFCEATTINVNITERQPEEKFDVVMNNGDFLHRVGNDGTVAIDKLFKAKDGVTVGNVSVTVEAVNGTAASGTYSNNAIQFNGTGVVKVTITDNDYCIPAELYLEVVEAVNATTVKNADGNNNVVLLNDVSGSFTVYNGNTIYGNGFTVTLPTNYQAKYTAGYVGYITMNNGNLDNVRIEGPTYPVMNIYQSQAQNSVTDKEEYFYNSILINGGNCTISNSYISGSRTAICVRGGNDVVIENTTLSGGAVANMEIAGANTVTLRNLTTVQVDEYDSYGQNKIAHGMGVYVSNGTCKICVEGEMNQRNWVSQTQWNSLVGDYAPAFPRFFTDSAYANYRKTIDGATYVNLAMVFACNWDANNLDTDNQTNKNDYGIKDKIEMQGYTGGVYSVTGKQPTINDLQKIDYKPTGFAPIAPKFDFDNSANFDADDENNAMDTYCEYSSDTGILSIGITGSTKTIDLSGISIKKNGVALNYTAYLNGVQISGNSVTIKSADGTKQTLVFKVVSNEVGYDVEGNPIDGEITYTYTINLEVATLSYPAPVWNVAGYTSGTTTYKVDTTNCYYVYYQTSQGYGEAVPIYDGIKINYYDKNGKLVEEDLSNVQYEPKGKGETISLNNAFTYTLADDSILTMTVTGSYKSGVTSLYCTNYNGKTYVYPSALDSDSNVRPSKTGYDFNVSIKYTFTDPNGLSTEEITINWYGAKANGSSIKDAQWKTFDSDNGKEPSCLVEGTLITMADGTQKPVEDLKVGDMVMIFNHVTGQYEAMPLIFNTHADVNEAKNYDVLYLQFADGRELKIVQSHGLFDTTLMQYVYINYDNYMDYIGHEFYALNSDGTAGENVELVNAFIQNENVRIFCPVTYFHMNSFANGFLNTPNIPGDITGLVNYFEYDEDLKYNEEKMQADIEKYGLYTYDDFSGYISEAAYNSSPSVYLKVAVGKGMITYEQIIDVIEYLLAGSLIDN